MSVKEMLDNWKLMSLIREFDLYVKEFAKSDDARIRNYIKGMTTE
mgnify:CR=1 FL=1